MPAKKGVNWHRPSRQRRPPDTCFYKPSKCCTSSRCNTSRAANSNSTNSSKHCSSNKRNTRSSSKRSHSRQVASPPTGRTSTRLGKRDCGEVLKKLFSWHHNMRFSLTQFQSHARNPSTCADHRRGPRWQMRRRQNMKQGSRLEKSSSSSFCDNALFIALRNRTWRKDLWMHRLEIKGLSSLSWHYASMFCGALWCCQESRTKEMAEEKKRAKMLQACKMFLSVD